MLACLLTAAAKLHRQQAPDSAGAVACAMRDLDLAVMMGGRRFRKQADELIAALHSALKVPANAASRGNEPTPASRQGVRQSAVVLAWVSLNAVSASSAMRRKGYHRISRGTI